MLLDSDSNPAQNAVGGKSAGSGLAMATLVAAPDNGREGGGVSLRGSTLQRLFRDAYSGTQHVTVSVLAGVATAWDSAAT